MKVEVKEEESEIVCENDNSVQYHGAVDQGKFAEDVEKVCDNITKVETPCNENNSLEQSSDHTSVDDRVTISKVLPSPNGAIVCELSQLQRNDLSSSEQSPRIDGNSSRCVSANDSREEHKEDAKKSAQLFNSGERDVSAIPPQTFTDTSDASQRFPSGQKITADMHVLSKDRHVSIDGRLSPNDKYVETTNEVSQMNESKAIDPTDVQVHISDDQVDDQIVIADMNVANEHVITTDESPDIFPDTPTQCSSDKLTTSSVSPQKVEIIISTNNDLKQEQKILADLISSPEETKSGQCLDICKNKPPNTSINQS